MIAVYRTQYLLGAWTFALIEVMPLRSSDWAFGFS